MHLCDCRDSRASLPLTGFTSRVTQVFDGDIPYLYKQSRNNRMAFQNAIGNDWVKEYFLPGQSDRCAHEPLGTHVMNRFRTRHFIAIRQAIVGNLAR